MTKEELDEIMKDEAPVDKPANPDEHKEVSSSVSFLMIKSLFTVAVSFMIMVISSMHLYPWI